MTERRGRRRKQLLDDLKEKRGHWKLKEEALDRTLWRIRFGRGYGPVVRQKMNYENGLDTWHSHPEYQLSYKSVSWSVRERLRLPDAIFTGYTTHPHNVICHLLSLFLRIDCIFRNCFRLCQSKHTFFRILDPLNYLLWDCGFSLWCKNRNWKCLKKTAKNLKIQDSVSEETYS
jgi:hypothetical protein